MSTEKVCFVICPIGDEGTDIRERSNLTYEYIIKPVVKQFGYRPNRADYINESGMITSQIIDQIVESSLVIADLSDNNPNVFYELAIRHIVQTPYIQMIRTGQNIPFDITGMRTISFDVDLESAHRAKKELFDQIESIENNKFKPDNPITSAINQKNIHKMLTEKGNIEPDSISKIVLESVSELRSMIIDIKSELHHKKEHEQNLIIKSRDKSLNNQLNTVIHKIEAKKEHINDLTTFLSEIQYDLDGNKVIKQDKEKEAIKYEIDILEKELQDLIVKKDQIRIGRYFFHK